MQADIAIIGGGCAGYSLLSRLLHHEKFTEKRIVVIDHSPHASTQKTWCFWQNKPGYYDHLICKTWTTLHISKEEKVITPSTGGYTYNMIRSSDFYNYHHRLLQQHANVALIDAKVLSIDANAGMIKTGEDTITAEHIFSSVLLREPEQRNCDIDLQQHFRGWFIKTTGHYFKQDEAELMNFSTSQQYGLAFFYVLPTSANTALVEYTLFTGQLLSSAEYDEALQTFCTQRFGAQGWVVMQQEEGVIPMSTRRFPGADGRVHYIGTAGGQTKPSTGYTFQFIQKHSDYIVEQLAMHHKVLPMPKSRRFDYYDAILLQVLRDRKYPGDQLFINLFERNPLPRLFRFLDNESILSEEFRLMNTTPLKFFLPVALRRLNCF